MYLLCCLSLETSINPFQGVRIIPSLPVWKRRFCIMKIAIRELVHTETGNPEYAGTRTGRTKSGYCIKIGRYFFLHRFTLFILFYFFCFFHLCYSSSISLIPVWRYVPVLGLLCLGVFCNSSVVWYSAF